MCFSLAILRKFITSLLKIHLDRHVIIAFNYKQKITLTRKKATKEKRFPETKADYFEVDILESKT
jgi:hypothetical protein